MEEVVAHASGVVGIERKGSLLGVRGVMRVNY